MALVGGVAPAGPGWAAAVVSVEAQSSEQRQDQVARGRILLCAPGEGLLPLDVGEAGVASAVVEALSRECPVCIDCGPRGRIRAEPAIRSS